MTSSTMLVRKAAIELTDPMRAKPWLRQMRGTEETLIPVAANGRRPIRPHNCCGSSVLRAAEPTEKAAALAEEAAQLSVTTAFGLRVFLG